MYPVPTHWPNTLWTIGASVFGLLVLGQIVRLGFAVKDQLWPGSLSIVGGLCGTTVFFVLCVDRTTWSPSWLTTFLDRQLRRRSGSPD